MKARILDGPMAGIEFNISKETEKKLQAKKKLQVKPIGHGDYGFYYGTKTDPVVIYKDCDSDTFKVLNDSFRCDFTLSDDSLESFVRVGNIFDDLKEK